MGSEDRSDDEHLRALAAGDVTGFEVLFARHGDFVHNFVFRRTASWSRAEDVTETVFLELWRQRRRLTAPSGSIRPWLVTVASNQVKRGWRADARWRRAFDHGRRSADHGAHDDHADAVAARVDDERRMAQLLDALDGLPAPHREVLTLWAWEQLSYDEIAAALGVPVGTVRSRLNRARARLHSLTGAGTGAGTATAQPDATTATAPEDRGGWR